MSCNPHNRIIGGESYECQNIGTGIGCYFQENVVGDNVTFEFKSLVAGSNVVLASNNETIIISSEKIDTLNNAGSGSFVGQSIVNDTLNLRSLVGNGSTTLTQNANDITINSPIPTNIGIGGEFIYSGLVGNQYQFKSITSGNGITLSANPTNVIISNTLIQSASNSIIYNYGQTTSVNLASSYNSPDAVISNIGAIDQDSGTIVQTSLTTIDYTPAPRTKKAAFFTFTTTTAGATNNSIVQISPNILYADDEINDYMLASGSNGLLYQISPTIAAENLMLNYDGTPVGLTSLATIAFSIADNLLFYTQLTATNVIRVYDFTTKADALLVNAATVSGWSGGAVICDMCFCQANNTLYAKGDTSAARLLSITIRPYDHIPPVRYDTVATYAQPYTLTGGINLSMFITDGDDVYFAVRPSIGNTQISISNRLGAGTSSFGGSTIPEANTSTKKIVMGASGNLYCYSIAGNAFYRIAPGGSIGNGFTLVKNLTRSYSSFTRSPYGITVI